MCKITRGMRVEEGYYLSFLLLVLHITVLNRWKYHRFIISEISRSHVQTFESFLGSEFHNSMSANLCFFLEALGETLFPGSFILLAEFSPNKLQGWGPWVSVGCWPRVTCILRRVEPFLHLSAANCGSSSFYTSHLSDSTSSASLRLTLLPLSYSLFMAPVIMLDSPS